MAERWIQGAVKHKGALTKSAHAAGESPMEFAQEHKHDSGTTGNRARLAITLRGMHAANGAIVEPVPGNPAPWLSQDGNPPVLPGFESGIIITTPGHPAPWMDESGNPPHRPDSPKYRAPWMPQDGKPSVKMADGGMVESGDVAGMEKETVRGEKPAKKKNPLGFRQYR